jgi:plasmid replication initiation protein
MARAKKANQTASPPSTQMRRFDEANVARLGLISIQERIPADFTHWNLSFEMDGRMAKLSCVAPSEHGGVPHGLDNDVSMALMTLFMEAGCPEDGTFVTTAHNLLRYAGFDNNGHYYKVLRDSLERLYAATYTASEAWRDHERKLWVTVKFRYIDRLEYTSESDRLNFDGRSILNITLPKEVVRSVRSRYVKPLDLAFLTTLERPHTRALYRLLDAQRYSPEDPNKWVVSYNANLVEWGRACKLVDLKPARVRRALEGAHQELLERGYLKTIEYDGRGEKQNITYVFGEVQGVEVDAHLLERLNQHGVTLPVGRKLVQEFGVERVEERFTRFEAMLRAGYAPRSRGAVLVDVVRDDTGKYTDTDGNLLFEEARGLPTPSAKVPRKTAPKIKEKPVLDVEIPMENSSVNPETSHSESTLEEQANRALSTLQVLFGKRLTTLTYARIRSAIEHGQLEGGQLVKNATKAAMELRLEDMATQLVGSLELEQTIVR